MDPVDLIILGVIAFILLKSVNSDAATIANSTAGGGAGVAGALGAVAQALKGIGGGGKGGGGGLGSGGGPQGSLSGGDLGNGAATALTNSQSPTGLSTTSTDDGATISTDPLTTLFDYGDGSSSSADNNGGNSTIATSSLDSSLGYLTPQDPTLNGGGGITPTDVDYNALIEDAEDDGSSYDDFGDDDDF
jgi:hypothetical protein